MLLLLMITFVAAWAEQPKQILPITTATDVGWYQQNMNTIESLPVALIVEQNNAILPTESITISAYQYKTILTVPEVALNLKYPLTNINTNNCPYSVANSVAVCINNTRQIFGGDKQNGDLFTHATKLT